MGENFADAMDEGIDLLLDAVPNAGERADDVRRFVSRARRQ